MPLPSKTKYPRWMFAFATVLIASTTTVSAQPASADAEQPSIRRDAARLTLAGAQRAIAASRSQAEKMGVLSNIAVVDEGGHLLAFVRMDGARPSSAYTSITKATAAATHRQATGPIGGDDIGGVQLSLALEQAAAASGGKFTTLRGGVPIVCDDQVIGAIGVGGATGEQDAEVAAAGVAAVTQTFQNENENENEKNNNTTANSRDNRLIGKWLIEDIAGQGVVDNSQSTLEINDDNSISGDTSVNYFFGQAKIDGDQVSFGQMGATRRAGPPALMDQETKYLAALNKVARYEVDDNGLLHLFDQSDEELLRASSTK